MEHPTSILVFVVVLIAVPFFHTKRIRSIQYGTIQYFYVHDFDGTVGVYHSIALCVPHSYVNQYSEHVMALNRKKTEKNEIKIHHDEEQHLASMHFLIAWQPSVYTRKIDCFYTFAKPWILNVCHRSENDWDEEPFVALVLHLAKSHFAFVRLHWHFGLLFAVNRPSTQGTQAIRWHDWTCFNRPALSGEWSCSSLPRVRSEFYDKTEKNATW